ncbi:MAG: glycerol-3-phosphate 1-O-acyltransferase PlsY [Planctomycetes bacterium]|nr:glycerol-3-phosphate 1-O-acyltransferase PlsY [Planctomycetota bacterium]
MIIAVSLIIAYLLGSIPFGLVIARAHHLDLRQHGSGNIGATNVTRTLGKKWGGLCFALDVLKGALPTLLFVILAENRLIQGGMGHQTFLWVWLAVGFSTVLGHVFPIYAGFKGGKGVATSFGVGLGLWPYFTGCAIAALITWAVIVRLTRTVSLASIIAAILFPLYLIVVILLVPQWHFQTLWPLILIGLAIAVTVVVRHKENIQRLLAGTENKTRDTSE